MKPNTILLAALTTLLLSSLTSAQAEKLPETQIKVLMETSKTTARIGIPASNDDPGPMQEMTNMMPPGMLPPGFGDQNPMMPDAGLEADPGM